MNEARSLREATWVWAKIAALSFGGPAGQIALMHRVLVEERKWIGDARFLHALNFCMLLPGPEAQQLATYIGWLLHRTKGGLIAGGLFILPGFVAIMALSWLYVLYGDLPAIEALFFGLKAAVLAIVFEAVRRIASRAIHSGPARLLAAAAFAALFLLAMPFPVVVLAAGLIGWLAGRSGHGAWFAGHGTDDGHSVIGDMLPDHARAGARSTTTAAVAFLLLWLAPIALLIAWLGTDHRFSQIAVFFSQMAMVTFGGAYAVLTYVAQEAAGPLGWVTATEMLDGLAMAETTPGPLIMVLQFVGFLAAWREPGGLDPLLAATLGAMLATWVTFTPCFLWIFAGAPYAERLRSNRALSSALGAITAAVVGVILNLAFWFALHNLFREVERLALGPLRVEAPNLASFDAAAAALALVAILATFGLRLGTVAVLALCGAGGIAWRLLG